jgi:PucR-like helix-turn-helix protein/diguanylate cyclase with GGDEF domain
VARRAPVALFRGRARVGGTVCRTVLDDVQQIVDEVAEDLGRPVVLEDERHSLIAHSAHAHSDAVREKALLFRQTPPEAIAWVTGEGLLEAEGPLRIPPNPALKAESRVCTPIRDLGKLRGFLSVLDPEQTLSERDLARCSEAATALAEVLHDLRVAQEAPFARERELVETLLTSPDPTARESAGTILINERRLMEGDFAVLVVRVADPRRPRPPSADVVAAITQIIRRARHAFPAHSLAAAPRTGHAALVLSLEPIGRRGPGGAAQRVDDALAPLVTSGVLSTRPTVAFGDVANALVDIARAYDQALPTTRVADALGASSPLGWGDLGVYQSLVHVPVDELGDTAIDRRILRLKDKTDFLKTLETYLEFAGDVKRTAEELALHRASLYYRLGKIEELAELDLRSGSDRLAAHLSLKALRLTGRIT